MFAISKAEDLSL